MPVDPFVSLIVLHRCGHPHTHPVPQRLNDNARERVTATLSQERCWRCLTNEAWEQLPPWSPVERPAP
jgi:hypothetical protein